MNSNKSATIATAIVAVFAIVIAVIAITKYADANREEYDMEEDLDSVFIPSDELSEEIKDAAAILIKNNYEVAKLFYIVGLDHEEEPYGNAPEDGYYTVVSDKYTKAEEVFSLLSETFVEDEVIKIKTDPLGFGAPLYIDKKNGKLGIHMDFERNYNYSVDWTNPSFVIIPSSNTECVLKVTLKVGDMAVTENLNMIKLNGKWLLDRAFY